MMDDTLFNPVEQKEETINFATITAIFEDGVTLRFDGETEPTQKHYKVNSFVVFKVNDRVRIIKDSGTYIVEYSVGNPKTEFVIDKAEYAKTAGSANTLNGKMESQLLVATSKNFTDKHTGSAIGFFNSGWAYKRGVANVSSNASVSQTNACLNRLLEALRAYGLIGY